MSTIATNLHPTTNAARDPAAGLGALLPTTEFVEAFKSEFLQPPGTEGFIWPADDSSHAVITAEFSTIMKVLLESERDGEPPPTGSGDLLRDRVIQFVADQQWPDDGPPLPPEWQGDDEQEDGRLTEIWLICRALLEAIGTRGNGGNPSTIPPHGP